MPPIEQALLDLESNGTPRKAAAREGDAGGAGFLEALLETPELQDADIDPDELRGLLDTLSGRADGEALPEGGEALPEKLDALMGALSELDAKGGEAREGLELPLRQRAAAEALGRDGRVDLAALADREREAPGELSLDGQGRLYLDGDLLGRPELDSDGRAVIEEGKLQLADGGEVELGSEEAAGLLGSVDLQAALDQRRAAERARLLEALADLEQQGISGRELAAALQERMEGMEAAAERGDTAALDPDEGVAGALAGGVAALIESLDEGVEGKRSIAPDGQRGAALGEQIARELRLGGLVTGVPVGGESASGGSSTESQSGQGQGGGQERSAAAEAMLRSVSATNAASSEGGREFGGLLAAAQGLEGGQRSGTVQMSLQHPVGQQGFGDAVGERVVWMVNEQVQQARLQLNPPGLGPLDIQINVGDERTSVQITAHNAATREALEADMDRLRNLLAEQGHADVDVEVSQGDEDTEEAEGQADGAAGSEDGDAEAAAEPDDPAPRGLIDHYA